MDWGKQYKPQRGTMKGLITELKYFYALDDYITYISDVIFFLHMRAE